jgi:hypothetical protein
MERVGAGLDEGIHLRAATRTNRDVGVIRGDLQLLLESTGSVTLMNAFNSSMLLTPSSV